MVLSVLTVLFWLACFLVVYPYFIYPIILMLLNRFSKQPENISAASNVPISVGFVISAYNEDKVISNKIQNTLELDYPPDQLTIYVVSDASDDNTDSIVSNWENDHSNIHLIRQDDRKGKTAGLNRVMQIIKADIVVFSDANAIYDGDALSNLLQPFADPSVGYAVGSALYIDDDSDATKQSEGLYWKYELWIKKMESGFYSVVGGDGAIYAIRRHLFWTLKDSDINDFVNPLQIISHNYTGKFVDSAKCYEEASDEFKKEFKRKRRIVNRSWRAVVQYASQLSVRRHFRFVFMLYSHKVIRWLSLLFVFFAILSSTLITWMASSFLYGSLLVLIVSTITVAVIGWLLDRNGKDIPKLVYLIYYFYLVGTASMLGIWDNFRGVTHSTWGHIRT